MGKTRKQKTERPTAPRSIDKKAGRSAVVVAPVDYVSVEERTVVLYPRNYEILKKEKDASRRLSKMTLSDAVNEGIESMMKSPNFARKLSFNELDKLPDPPASFLKDYMLLLRGSYWADPQAFEAWKNRCMTWND